MGEGPRRRHNLQLNGPNAVWRSVCSGRSSLSCFWWSFSRAVVGISWDGGARATYFPELRRRATAEGQPRTRQRGRSQIGQKAGGAANQAGQVAKEALNDGSLTAKIKAKMALDDTVNAREINVDTVDGVVTISGRCNPKPPATGLQPARETQACAVCHVTVRRADAGAPAEEGYWPPTGPFQPVARNCCSRASQSLCASLGPFT